MLIGPHTFNFSEATAGAVAAGAAQRVADADALVHTVAELFRDPERRDAMREAARRISRGASRRGAATHGMDQPQLDAALHRRAGEGGD